MIEIKRIVIHHSASSWGNVEEIRRWHTSAPRYWRDIGYNILILNGYKFYGQKYDKSVDGKIEIARGLDFDKYISPLEKGAHTLGYNQNSIGVCYVGKDDPTPNQFESLELFCKMWDKIIPGIEVAGHNDYNDTKCPGFDVKGWWRYANA